MAADVSEPAAADVYSRSNSRAVGVCTAARTGGAGGAGGKGARTGSGTIKFGSDPATNSGCSERPQPSERSPPKPVSASTRNAALSGSDQRASAASSAKLTTPHSPAPGANSRHAVRWISTAAPLTRSTAPCERRATRNGPERSPGSDGSRQPDSPSRNQRLSWRAFSATRSRTSESGTKRALRHRTLGDGGGGHRLRGGGTNWISSRNGNSELSRTAGSLAAPAVAPSHSSSCPRRSMACDTAENSASL